ncbi:MAG TPA: DoxX family protein [Candidatus Acidoferrales bacterium]|nr:DoxX family protein [Candidatus Acidoferrales bacterium]
MGLEYGLLIVRLALGLAIAAHGAQKLFGWFGGYGIAGTGGFFESLGFRPGKLFAAAAGSSEFFGGILIVLGLFGGVGPMLVLSTMLVAMLTVHVKNGFWATNNGIEVPFIYATGAVAIAFASFGAISLDAWLGLALTSKPAIVWGLLALGVVGALLMLLVRRAPLPQQQT